MIRVLIAALALSAAACASSAEPEPSPPAGDADQCRASEYQWLVGRKRSEIPPQPAGAIWRITCTTCPVTMDYSPRRLNIFFDEASQEVKQVRCG